jgi:hypothetical protein
VNNLIIDAHVHIYDFYDKESVFASAISNLKNIAARDRISNPYFGLALTERYDSFFFRETFRNEKIDGLPECRVERVTEGGKAMRVYSADSEPILILPGRQIVSCERLEILSFLVDIDLKDRALSFSEIFKIIWSEGGIPVVNWAPGKWLFKRGQIVQELIESDEYRPILLGDTSLRPNVYPEPDLMKLGRRFGVKTIAGSDPLPFGGEEKLIGSYGMILPEFDPGNPIASIKNQILKSGIGGDNRTTLTKVGRRSNILSFTNRMARLYLGR